VSLDPDPLWPMAGDSQVAGHRSFGFVTRLTGGIRTILTNRRLRNR